MFTTAIIHNPQLNKMNSATAEQLSKFIQIKAEKGSRFLFAEMIDETLVMNWRTGTGYFVQAKYNQAGERIERKFYLNWSDTENKPFNPWKVK